MGFNNLGECARVGFNNLARARKIKKEQKNKIFSLDDLLNRINERKIYDN